MHQFLIECIDKNTTTVKLIIILLEEIVLIIKLEFKPFLFVRQCFQSQFPDNIFYNYCRCYRYDVYIRKDVNIEGATNHLPLSHFYKVITGLLIDYTLEDSFFVKPLSIQRMIKIFSFRGMATVNVTKISK